MKKIIALLIAVFMISSAAAAAAAAIELPDVPLIYDDETPGDINNDGSVDNKDVVALFRLLSTEIKVAYSARYDVNNDKAVNNKDVTILFRNISAM